MKQDIAVELDQTRKGDGHDQGPGAGGLGRDEHRRSLVAHAAAQEGCRADDGIHR